MTSSTKNYRAITGQVKEDIDNDNDGDEQPEEQNNVLE